MPCCRNYDIIIKCLKLFPYNLREEHVGFLMVFHPIVLRIFLRLKFKTLQTVHSISIFLRLISYCSVHKNREIYEQQNIQLLVFNKKLFS